MKKNFGSLFLVAVMVISIFCGGFTQTVFAGNVTIKAKSTMMHAEVYSVISRLKPDGTIELISEGPVTNGTELSATIDDSEQVCFVFFGKPEKGYLITGVGTTGKNNISHISELNDPEKKRLRTEGKVPEEILQRLKEEGYLFAWGYTRGGSNGTKPFEDNVNGFKPEVHSSITNTSGDIEPGKPVTMKVVIEPKKAFRDGNDKRSYETYIPAGEATITIDGKRVIPVTGIERKNKNLYEGTISFVLSDEDASVNTHTAVVNANVHYTAQLALTSDTGSYRGKPVETTTVVEAPPATVSFNLISGPSRKLIYDLNYPGAETIAPEYHNSGTSVTVRSDNYVRPGYEFGGWDTLDSQGNAVNRKPSDTFIMPDRVTGTKLTARWRPYLTVDCDNGSAVYTNAYEIGSIATPVRPVKQDYYFSGWRDENGREYGVNEDIIMPDRPLSIKAGWYNTIASVPQFMRPALTNDKPKTEDAVDKNTEDKTEKNVDKKTENKTDKKAADKKTENKTDKKAADKKTENKTDKKAADKKTENKADKKAADKTADKKTENKTDKKTVSGKKEQQEAKSGKNTDKKPSEGRTEKKNTTKNQEKNKPDVTKQETADEETKADDLDSKAEDKISDTESEKDTDGNTEDKISDDTEDKETAEDEVSKEDGKEKKTAENDKKKNPPENEKNKEEYS